MSGGGGKGGSQTSQVKIPKWVEQASQQNLDRANEIAQIGYTPYYGPDVAAFNPMQEAAFGNTGQAAGAFGLSGGGLTGMEGMPQAQDFGGGLLGYSSAPIFEQSLDAFAQARPGQAQAMGNLFIDPITGAPTQGGQPMQQAQNPQGFSGGGGGGSDRDYSRPYSGGASTGGYTSFGDMFDGGGAGQSGSTFQGGGPISTAANMVARPRDSVSSVGSSGMGGGK